MVRAGGIKAFQFRINPFRSVRNVAAVGVAIKVQGFASIKSMNGIPND